MILDGRIQQYLNYKGLTSKEHSLKDFLSSELEYLTLECDARHL
jgi:hypothetical protein